MRVHFTLTFDGDYLRLAAYRLVLQEIAAGLDQNPWEADPDAPSPAELAAAALQAFQDDEEG